MNGVANLRAIVEQLLDDEALFGADGACPVHFEDGSNERVLLITGGNASGKSFACRYLDEIARRDKVEFMRVGMGMRTQSGIQRGLMFGDETTSSTGIVSAKVVATGERTCRGRANPHFLCLDEPDIGMSEEMQDATGQQLARIGSTLPGKTLGMIVVTHSRAIAGRLMALDPLRLRCGDDQRATSEWVSAGPLTVAESELEVIYQASKTRRSAIQAVLNARHDKKGRYP